MALELRHLPDADTEGRQNHDVVCPERVCALAWVGQEPDALRAEPIVDVGIVNNLVGEIHALVRKPLAGLVRVVDGAVDAVAEPEFPGEVDCQSAALSGEITRPHLVDDAAVVRRGELCLDGPFQVETLAEDEGGHCPLSYRSTLQRGLRGTRDQQIHRVDGVHVDSVTLIEFPQRRRCLIRSGLHRRGCFNLRRLDRRPDGVGGETSTQLAADESEHDARRGGNADPGWPDAATVHGPVVRRLRREGNDARRPVDLLEAAEDLCLLRRQSLCREGRVSVIDRDRSQLIEPPAQLNGALGADVASIEMDGTLAGCAHLSQRAFGQVPTTKNNINEPHELTSLATRPRARRLPRAGYEGAESHGTDAREPSTR